MKTLELLGLQPDGENLTLTDEEGNRYTLAISDQLRAALRRDRATSEEAGEVKQLAPREIQALVRGGKSIEEVCEISAMPYSKVQALAYPIVAEREYTATTARSFPIGREVGALTVEEVVASRLLSRGVKPEEIRWDATREAGSPWVLTAQFTSGDKTRTASWHVNMDHRSLEAIDDEGAWLSETQIPAPASPWRHPNTPIVEPSNQEPVAPASTRIDNVLASLDAQRGKQRPMPSEEPEVPESPSADSPIAVLDDEILDLPPRETLVHAPDAAETVSPLFSVPEPSATPSVHEKRRRGDRPQMPSWDEIVFGKKD